MNKNINHVLKNIKSKFLLIYFFYLSFVLSASAQISIVACGWDKECTISDFILSSSLFAEFIIKIIFPALFFIGAFFSLIPMFTDPDNPNNRAETKHRFKLLLIGTGLILGAYLIIISILSLFNVRTDIIEKTISSHNRSYNSDSYQSQLYQSQDIYQDKYNVLDLLFFDKVYAIQNPLENITVQEIVLSIINGVVFIAMIIGGYCVVRGGFMLVWSYQNPNNTSVDYLQKGKWWVISGLLIWSVFFGGQYFVDVIYNTMVDFTNVTDK